MNNDTDAKVDDVKDNNSDARDGDENLKKKKMKIIKEKKLRRYILR